MTEPTGNPQPADNTAAPASGLAPDLVVGKAREAAKTEGFQAQMYKAIAVQRPVVIEYLRSVRRAKPHATPAEVLKELDSRYVATVTITSSGVGASAAIPGVGIPIALGLGVADVLFFYETSALYVLAVAELHGISVDDPERAKPLVLGMLLGQKSQSQVNKMVMNAVGLGGISATQKASDAVGKKLPKGWGEVLTEQLPESALAPLTIALGRESIKLGGKLSAGAVGKAIPFGVGAVIGGVGSFTFGRDVVKAARMAFPESPTDFPDWLEDYEKPTDAEPSRAQLAFDSAAGNVKDFGESVWDVLSTATEAFRSVDLDGDGIPDEARALTAVKRAGAGVAGTVSKGAEVFRSVDIDGDGVPDEARAVTAVKDAGAAITGVAGSVRGKAAALFGRKRGEENPAGQEPEAEQPSTNAEPTA